MSNAAEDSKLPRVTDTSAASLVKWKKETNGCHHAYWILNMELRHWQAPPRTTHKPRTQDSKRAYSMSGLFFNASCQTLASTFKQLRMLSPMTLCLHCSANQPSKMMTIVDQ
jgi:hypothetical protein